MNRNKKKRVKHGCYSLTKETLLSLNLKNNTDIYSYNSVLLLFI
jgi:hypothetical protein